MDGLKIKTISQALFIAKQLLLKRNEIRRILIVNT